MSTINNYKFTLHDSQYIINPALMNPVDKKGKLIEMGLTAPLYCVEEDFPRGKAGKSEILEYAKNYNTIKRNYRNYWRIIVIKRCKHLSKVN